MSMTKILSSRDVSALDVEIERLRERVQKNYGVPSTPGEVAADTPAQAAARAAIEEQRRLERKLVFLQSKLESAWEYGDKAGEKRLAEAIEQVMLELGAIRSVPTVAPNDAVAKSELGADRRRGANALDTILRQPSIKKSELPDPLELSNGLGIRSQTKIK